MGLLEKEYALKLSGRLGKPNGASEASPPGQAPSSLAVATQDYVFLKSLYDAYRGADKRTKQAFATVCESILNLPKAVISAAFSDGGNDPQS